VESTEGIVVMMELLQKILHVLDRGLSMEPVLCHKVRIHLVVDVLHISKMYFSHWEPPGVCERRRSVNLESSISGENQTLGRHSGRPSELLESLMTGTGALWERL